MKKLLIISTFLALTSSVFAAEQALTSNMKRAHKVEPLEVKTLPDNKAKVVALLTYPDGTTAKCEYLMRVKVVKAAEQTGFQYLPLSEKCGPASK